MASKKPAPKAQKKKAAAAPASKKSNLKAGLVKSVAMPVIRGNKAGSIAKTAKGGKVAPATAVAAPGAEAEETDEDFEEGASSGASAGGAQAALNAAISSGSSSGLTQKNFRNHPDMENFFRFIHENDLRLEALEIIDEIILQRDHKKKAKGASPTAQ